MKVCIYGAGAIGGYLGGALARVSDGEVTLIARGAHLAAIRQDGLTLIDRDEEYTVHPAATDKPEDVGPQDFVVVSLKAHQAWEAADRMAPLLGPETAVVTCQNGVPWWYFHRLDGPYRDVRLASVDPGDRQWNAIGPERAIGCVVYTAAEIKAPGVINNIYGNRFAIGEPSGEVSPRCRQLSEAIQNADLKAPVLDRIRDEIWLKLWGNLCFNPISALTRATLDVVASDPGTRALSRAMMEEAYEIATRHGARFRIDIDQRIDAAARVGAHRTSMLQDVERGRGLEIDALLTAVQEMGRMVTAESPTIDMVLALIQQLGRTQGLYPTFPEVPPPAA
jgi:2-dehydropantoate 2-reductase